MAASVKRYQDLKAWQAARQLVADVYRLTGTFPASEQFCLTSQMRRCAVSIPSNIAEGNGREGLGDYLRFLHHARGSQYELETQLQLAVDLGLAGSDAALTVNERLAECGKLLQGLIRHVKAKRDSH